MAQQFDSSTIVKRVYTDSKTVLGVNNICQALFPYDGTHKPGEDLREHIWYTHIHGPTIGGRQRAPSLRKPVAARGVQPAINGTQLIIRAQMGYLAKWQTLQTEQAFEEAMVAERRQLELSLRLYIEILLMYGRHEWGLAKVDAVDNVNKKVSITAPSWSPGLWGQLINSRVDIVLPTVTNNVATAYTARAGASDLQVDHIVDTASAREVWFTNPNEDTGIVPDLSLVQQGDIIILNTALTAAAIQEGFGLLAIFQQQAGTSHTGVNLSTVYQLQPNHYDAVGDVLDFGRILSATNQVIPKGGHGTFYALVPPHVHTALDTQMAGFRRTDSSYSSKKFVNGVEGIELVGQAGTTIVTPHPFMMDGKALILPVKQTPPMVEGQVNPDLKGVNIRRVGEVEAAYAYPGGEPMEIPFLQDVAADERRGYSSQAPLVSAAGHGVFVDNFLNTRWS